MIAALCVLLTASPASALADASTGLDEVPRRGPSVSPRAGGGSADDVERYVSRQRDELLVPGMAVVVIRDGLPLVSRGFGVADPGGRPATAETPFLLGSTSKQFTGLIVQRLILEGRLSLETTVSDVLPSFGAGSQELSRVTVRDLLSHSSGLSTSTGRAQWGWRFERAGSIAAGASAIDGADVTAPPGARFEYSNSNYDILGAVIEAVTQQPFARAFDDLVSEPLGLRATSADLGRPPPDLAAGYYVWFGRLPVVTPAPRVPSAVPSSMVVSTASDLSRVVESHLGAGGPGTLDSALAAARAPLVRVDLYAEYASGWWVRPLWELNDRNENADDVSLASCVEHEGLTDRSMSYLLACPALGFGIVALANAGQGPDTDRWWRFHDGLVHAVLGTAPRPLAPDAVIRYAPAVFLGVPVAMALLLAGQVRAARRRKHAMAWSVLAAAFGVGALWLGYVYAPGRADGDPVHAMWSTVPDLAVSTIVGTLLAFTSFAVLAGAVLPSARTRADASPVESASSVER